MRFDARATKDAILQAIGAPTVTFQHAGIRAEERAQAQEPRDDMLQSSGTCRVPDLL